MDINNTFRIPIKDQKPKQINSIVALGNPMVDIIAEVDEELLHQYNLRKNEINYATNENSDFYSKIDEMMQVSKSPGGSVQNILRALSWNLKSNPSFNINNIKLSMLGCVGKDLYKNQIINSLKSLNIKTNLLEEISNMKTSKCAVATFNGDNYFLSDISASKFLSRNFVQNNWEEIISHDAIIIEGFFIKENFELCKDICNMFTDKGKYIILTLSDPYIVENYRNEINTIAHKADMIFGNYKSMKKFTGVDGIENLIKNIFQILNNKDRIILITVGNNGVFCGKFDYNTQNEIHFQKYPEKVLRNDIVDFNGAGDAFLGGFLSQQMQNQTFDNCCRCGNHTAAVVIKKLGCNFPKIIQ
jgi:adenosine kinase